MSSYLFIGNSMFGKTHLAKELMSKLQNENNNVTKLYILTTFPDEFRINDKKNSDKEIYLKRGNQMEIFDKTRIVNRIFSDEDKYKTKCLFIDDATSSLKMSNDKLLMKILSEIRHHNGMAILCCHYIHSVAIPYRSQFKDWILFGSQIKDKLKKFFNDIAGQYYERKLKINDQGEVEQDAYGFEDFYDEYNDFMTGGLAPDDPDRQKYFHNAFQFSFPTNTDARALMIKIPADKQYEYVGTKNAIFKKKQ